MTEPDFRRLAALAYSVADSGLDSGTPRKSAIDALIEEVIRLMDNGYHGFDALCEEQGIRTGPVRKRKGSE